MNQIFWYQRMDAPRDRPCLFLDRDGVVVEEVDYLHRSADVRVLGGARALIEAARAHNFAVGLVTNQAGVGRGFYDWAAFETVQATIAAELNLGEDPFDFIAACGSHPEATRPHLKVAEHFWRKPLPGMLLHAAAALDLQLEASVMVGDKLDDLEAGAAAGVRRLVHVRTGHGAAHRPLVESHAATFGDRLRLIETLDDAPRALGWAS